MKEFYIAGLQHHKSNQVIDELNEGTILELVPEPTNKYDSNAIAIKYWESDEGDRASCMLGYVPAKFAAEILASLQIHDDLICTISELTPTAKPWERIKVIIKPMSEIDKEGEISDAN